MRTSADTMNLATHCEAQLLGAMAMQAHAADKARAAWGELFVRHRNYLFVVASRAYGSFLGEDGVVDLVSDTFRRAFEWCGRQPDADLVRAQFTSPDADETRRRVLGWLGAIAQGLFRDRFREESAEAEKADQFHEDWLRSQAEEPEGAPEPSRHHLDAALAALSQNEADALRASLPWYDPDTQSFNVPRGEASRLAELLGTNPETLRQRRHRALQHIREYLEKAGYTFPSQEEES